MPRRRPHRLRKDRDRHKNAKTVRPLRGPLPNHNHSQLAREGSWLPIRDSGKRPAEGDGTA